MTLFNKDRINGAINQEYETNLLIIIFFITGFIGWIWEVLLEFLTDGIFVNKGTLIGPYLPIYGFGCLLILLLFTNVKMRKIASNLLLSFVLICVIFTFLEYGTSFYLEKVYGMRWWDYSDYYFNLNGRISLITSILFGIAGCFGLYCYAPFVNKLIKKVHPKTIKAICFILVFIIIVDFVYCFRNPNAGEGITAIIFHRFY